MVFFVIALIIGSIIALMIFLDGVELEEKEFEKATNQRIELEVQKRLKAIEEENNKTNKG